MDMLIRPAKVDDAAAIAAVQVSSWQTTYRGIMPDAALGAMTVPTRTDRWNWILTAGESRTYVAVDESGVFGFVSGGRLRETLGEYDGEIWALYLVQEKQRQGAGRRLIQTVADWLLESGYQSMVVWVLQENPAVSFYKRMGGVVVNGKMIEIGGMALPELALGWKDLSKLG
jgi:GNAT superfamily N-acetyltransferase